VLPGRADEEGKPPLDLVLMMWELVFEVPGRSEAVENE
jgi:hypothetical protein